ncbi:2-oxoacid:acceptor oxidoreductase subunit alpha [Pleionea mediterranea]|uniref:2-oxoglutarate ferredoxin oxidoreductase subunit alpha n=1 Tax=Pleionea mediterranea TaxID=523701 RepID=A0A316FQ29_9GAMM|nr:2-oxoacid:acceptor oxidoreductase subunit alpha [Pleionea mediterranea]PWK50898.1 2-oxoglutarate ferredoxin oxidoreductase subunit alpha [Pleionea mediterranea]
MRKIEAVNDFVIKFANINGTGSASANNMFAKSIFRSGVPVSPKNIFPSNIQGLPTWFEVRINDKGYMGRRGGVDFMVATNGQTMKQDYDEVLPGGYFLYDNTKPLPPIYQRTDINLIGIPLTDICIKEYRDPRQRQLFKNIIYVGALSYLLDIEFNVFQELVQDQFKGKEKLITPNIHALELGYRYAKENYTETCAIKVEKRDLTKGKILVDGNTGSALGAIYAGATVAGWYPITPSTSVVDAFEKYCKRLRIDPSSGMNNFAIIQAEDELAAMGMVLGASWNGARAFTATSGPGVSLMAEFLGLAYFAEIPGVLIDVQRTGPSTGMPTRTQQSDVLPAAYASHGDTKHICLYPANPKDCFEMSHQAFELTEYLQTPIIILSDLDLGMNDNISDEFEWHDDTLMNRGKVLSEDELENMSERWGRYLDLDDEGIGYRTIPGTHPTKGSYFTRGSSHDEYAAYTESSEAYVRSMKRLEKKWETAKSMVPAPVGHKAKKKANIGAIFYGTSTDASLEALDQAANDDVHINGLQIKAFPFNNDVKQFIDDHDYVFMIEQNRDGQMKSLLVNELQIDPNKIVSILNYDGMPITASFIVDQLNNVLDQAKVTPLQAEQG